MTFRLNKSDRDGIVSRAVDHAFEPRRLALRAEEHRIGMAAYEIVVPKAERVAASKLSERWLRTDDCLRFRFDFRQIRLRVEAAVLVPSKVSYCEDLGLVQDADLIAAFEKWDGERTAYKSNRDRAETAIEALVGRFATLRQLREAWPEGEPFYAHLKPREGAQLPAVQVEDLNKLLGLAA